MKYPAASLLFPALPTFAATHAHAQQSAPDERPEIPSHLELHADQAYAGTDNPRQTLDLVIPKKQPDAPMPLVVYIHGGKWLQGHKATGLRRVLVATTKNEFAVASIGYRLSGETIWPAQIHDCKAAIRWLRANAKTYHIDPDRIAVWGSSAGGHLAAMLGTSAGVESMDGSLGPHTNVSSHVTCVIDYFGPSDLSKLNTMAPTNSWLNHDAPDSPGSLLLGAPVLTVPEKVATANPITYVSKKNPAFLIVHGTKDGGVAYGQSELLHNALKKEGVNSTLLTVKGAGHGSGFGPPVSKTTARFLRHHLLDKKSDWADTTIAATWPKKPPTKVTSAGKAKVLLIGDSISIGYTPHVKTNLAAIANVRHHKGNAQHTRTGIAKLDSWIGKTSWDVIHFNWGLWDLCYRHPKSKVQGKRDKINGTITVPVEEYEKNLDSLVQRLKKTDATLIWAHTTVVPEGEAGRHPKDAILYNEAAARVMKKHGVAINDLHTLTSEFDAKRFIRPGDVHYTADGSQLLANQVADTIRSQLKEKQP